MFSKMDKQFFCIRGYMKSGTNWLGSLLSSHEEVDCVGEFHWQQIVAPANRAIRKLPIYSQDDGSQAEQLRAGLENLTKQLLLSGAHPKATLIGDRTPHTIEPVVIRGAKHICIVRDGRDVLVSRAFHLYNNPDSHRLFERFPELELLRQKFASDPWYFKNHPDDLLGHEAMVRESARWWRDHQQSDREACEKYPNLPVLKVRYEDLHADVQAERHKLFEFLGVNPRRCAQISGHLKAGFKEERPNEFLRKGSVGDWENYFTDQTRRWYKEEAGEELRLQGYVTGADW